MRAFILLLLTLITFMAATAEHGFAESIVGRGFNRAAKSLRYPCIDVPTAFVNDSYSEILLDSELSNRQLDDLVEGRFSGGINYVVASAKIDNKISSTLSQSDRTRSLLYRVTHHLGRVTVSTADPKLSEIGASALAGDAHHLRAVCGDQFVSEASRGGSLFIRVSYQFSSKEALHFIESKITFKLLGIKKVVRTAREIKRYAEHFDLTIDAFQSGGNPLILNELMKSLRTSECGPSNLDHCDDILSRLVDYGTDASGFVAQLEDSYNTFKTASYGQHGFLELEPAATRQPTPRQARMLRELRQRLGQEESLLLELRDLLSDDKQAFIGIQHQYELRDLLNTTGEHISHLQSAITSCRQYPDQCQSLHDASSFETPNDIEDQIPYKDFFYHCMTLKQSNTSAIEPYLAALGTDDCRLADQRRQTLRSLNLSHADLVDVNLVRFFDALTELDISHNQLHHLLPLSGLIHLEILKADNNQLIDVSGLKSLTALDELSLHKNLLHTLPAFSQTMRAQSVSLYLNLFDSRPNLPGFDQVIFTGDEACQHETMRAVARGDVSAAEARMYLEIGFAFDPIHHAFLNCLAAVNSY